MPRKMHIEFWSSRTKNDIGVTLKSYANTSRDSKIWQIRKKSFTSTCTLVSMSWRTSRKAISLNLTPLLYAFSGKVWLNGLDQLVRRIHLIWHQALKVSSQIASLVIQSSSATSSPSLCVTSNVSVSPHPASTTATWYSSKSNMTCLKNCYIAIRKRLPIRWSYS